MRIFIAGVSCVGEPYAEVPAISFCPSVFGSGGFLEFDEDFASPVIAAASRSAPYHLSWDDIDKLKLTDFKTEVLSDLVDSLYPQKHGLTVTGNYSMRDLVEHERMHPAIVRRLDDICRVVEV